jgi:hypothetical protein
MSNVPRRRQRRRQRARVALRAMHTTKGGPAESANNNNNNGSQKDLHCAPDQVHTHARQRTSGMVTFAELLNKPPVLVDNSTDDDAFGMADYCTAAREMMETVIRLLESTAQAGTSMARLNDSETRALRALRAQWLDHLRGNFYGLIGAPPATGGATARYSLGVQLWLLIMHANCILQLSDEVSTLFDFYPPGSVYLSRNQLLVDDACVMQYPLRTTVLALETFIMQLDCIDRFHADYIRYATALEHRVAALVCHSGRRDEYNAIEWCTPAANADDEQQRKGDSEAEERVSDEFVMHSMVYLLTIYHYAENWLALNSTTVFRAEQREPERIAVRWPAHCVAEAEWAPSGRSMRRLTAFACNYAHTRQDDNYVRAIRTFLLQFELRPCDLDLYRVLMKTDKAHSRSVLQHEFQGFSKIARTYLRKVHYDRTVYSYIEEHMQFDLSADASSRSAPLARQGFTRQLAVLFILHQFIDGKFRLNFKSRFLLFQRDASFVTQMTRARALTYPVIVQQFARFSVFVPHQRPPQYDTDDILYWRAVARAERRNAPPPPAPPEHPLPTEHDCGQWVRAYDCMSALDAFAVWALFYMQMTGGRLDESTHLGDFLLDLFGWQSSYWHRGS